MLLIGRSSRFGTGLLIVTSNLSYIRKGCSLLGLLSSYLGRDISTPGTSPLLAEFSPCLIANSLGVQGAQLIFGLIPIFLSKVVVTAVERHWFLK